MVTNVAERSTAPCQNSLVKGLKGRAGGRGAGVEKERGGWEGEDFTLETRPDSPCESGMQPQVPVTPGEENSGLDTSLDVISFNSFFIYPL